MQETRSFLSWPQNPFTHVKWQLPAGAAWTISDLNSEAVVQDSLQPYSIEECLLDKGSGEILKERVTEKKVGADTLLCP